MPFLLKRLIKAERPVDNEKGNIQILCQDLFPRGSNMD
jgi:hypothetical protein